MKIKEITLKNNLKCLFIDSPLSKAASAQMWFRAGSSFEDKENSGIAHFLEHMFFKGTPSRPGAEIANEVESFGGEINAFTSFDYTCYYINAPTTKLTNTVDIIMDMVSNPTFKEEDLIPEREVVFEEYKRSIDSANQYSFSQIQKHCFQKPYNKQILGREETIKNFTRQQLIDFREKYYNSSNMLFIVAGNLENQDEIIKTIENYQLPSGKKSEHIKCKLKTKPAVNTHNKDVTLAQLTMVIPAHSYDDGETSGEDLAMNCLGFGESSRLQKALITNKAIAAHIGTSTMYFSEGGVHFLRLSCRPENLDKACDEVLNVLKKSLKEGFTKEEIKKIKNQYLSSKIYEKETIESFAFSLGHGFAQNGDPNCEEDFIKRIKVSSLRTVNNSVKNIFSRPIHLELQIPLKSSKKTFQQKLTNFQKKLKTLSIKDKVSTKKSIKNLKKNSKFDPAVTIYEVKPGVKLLHRHNPQSSTFSLQTYIKGGLILENSKNNGIHHLIAAMMTKGYGKVSQNKLNEILENKSASLSGFSGKNSYGLSVQGLSYDFDELFTIFEGSLFNPSMTAASFSKEKKILLREYEGAKINPVKICFRNVNELFFKDHPYARPLLGSIDNLKNHNAAKIKQYHRSNLTKREILFSYSGHLEASALIQHFEFIFDKLKSRKKNVMEDFDKMVPNNQKIHHQIEREQTHLFLGYPGYKYDKTQSIYLKMLTNYFSGQSSKLFVQVRDIMGLCYVAQPLHMHAINGSYWGIYMGTSNAKTQQAIEALTNLLKEFSDSGIDQKDFDKILNISEGQLLLNLQTNEDFLSQYSITELYDLGFETTYKNIERMKKIKLEDFNRFIKKFLAQKPNLILSGVDANLA